MRDIIYASHYANPQGYIWTLPTELYAICITANLGVDEAGCDIIVVGGVSA